MTTTGSNHGPSRRRHAPTPTSLPVTLLPGGGTCVGSLNAAALDA